MIGEIYNSILPYLPGLAFLTSLVSLYFAIASIQRTRKYQSYDYSPRLDVKEEIVQVVSRRDGQKHIGSIGSGVQSGNCPELIRSYGFAYQAMLYNQGSKVVDINKASILYGSSIPERAQVSHNIAGRFNLRPGEARRLSFTTTTDEVRKFMQEKKVTECMFHLRLTCLDAKGKQILFHRSLGGFQGKGIHHIVQSGDSLIPID